MKLNKQMGLVIVAFSGLLLLTQYQNCAPANTDSEEVFISNVNGVVNSIDDVNKDTAVSFVEKMIVMPETDAQLVVNGICSSSQDGARLRWDLFDMNQNQVASGFADCELGGFQIVSDIATQLGCGEEYILTARLGFGSPAYLTLEAANCQ